MYRLNVSQSICKYGKKYEFANVIAYDASLRKLMKDTKVMRCSEYGKTIIW